MPETSSTEKWGCNTLSKEIIESIRAAEAEAAKRKAEVSELARSASVKSKDDAKAEYDKAVLTAKADMEDKLALIAEQTEALVAKNKAEAEADAERETEAAMANMDAAVEIIIGELVKNVGK